MYSHGKRPVFTPEVLADMAREKALGIGTGPLCNEETGPGLMAAVSCQTNEMVMRIWYVSDGVSVALATYTCEHGETGRELNEAQEIVKSIEFLGDERQKRRAGGRKRR